MFVAQKLRQENMAEYLLYMWQVEDLIRAYGVNLERLQEGLLRQYKDLSEEQYAALENWYRELIDMMHHENVVEKGHLQICKNVMQNLMELHGNLISSGKFSNYTTAYHNVLPIIVALRAKNGNTEESEFETCFNFLYGVMLLRLQQKPISEETNTALKTVSTFLGMLSNYYKKDKENPLDF